VKFARENSQIKEYNDSEDTWTILRMILWSTDYLAGKGVENSRLDSEWLLAYALDTDRLQLYLQYDRPLSPEEREAFKPLLRRRARREPIQYILGRTSFRELELLTDKRVLIPRPETEILVEEVLNWALYRPEGLGKVLDIGTGSGAIAISLAVEGSCNRIIATDVSPDALEVAKENACRHGKSEKLDFRQGRLFDVLEEDDKFDIVVSNPPYVEEENRINLEPEINQWEPSQALFAGEDGLDVIRSLISGSPEFLLPGGLLALEIGMTQDDHVVELIRETESFEPASVRLDLNGRPRVVMAQRI
tara:strand:+ start:18134 stop:19048 length:915 start_codon:yes stop_codon:yes gene_type:complete